MAETKHINLLPKILITGGSGFPGNRIVEVLPDQNTSFFRRSGCQKDWLMQSAESQNSWPGCGNQLKSTILNSAGFGFQPKYSLE